MSYKYKVMIMNGGMVWDNCATKKEAQASARKARRMGHCPTIVEA